MWDKYAAQHIAQVLLPVGIDSNNNSADLALVACDNPRLSYFGMF